MQRDQLAAQFIKMLAELNNESRENAKYKKVVSQLKSDPFYREEMVKYVYSPPQDANQTSVDLARIFLKKISSDIPELKQEMDKYSVEISTSKASAQKKSHSTKDKELNEADFYQSLDTKYRDEDIKKDAPNVIKELSDAYLSKSSNASLIMRLRDDENQYNYYILRIVNFYKPKNSEEIELLKNARAFIKEQLNSLPALQKAQENLNNRYALGGVHSMFKEQLPAEISKNIANKLERKDANSVARGKKSILKDANAEADQPPEESKPSRKK